DRQTVPEPAQHRAGSGRGRGSGRPGRHGERPQSPHLYARRPGQPLAGRRNRQRAARHGAAWQRDRERHVQRRTSQMNRAALTLTSAFALLGATIAAPFAGAATYGAADDAPSHVTVTATAPSWIRVHSATGANIAVRVLQPGDSFRVPDQPG